MERFSDLQRHWIIQGISPYQDGLCEGGRGCGCLKARDHEEYMVHKILDSKRKSGRLWYLIDWEWGGPEERPWEPVKNIHTPVLVQMFHSNHAKTQVSHQPEGDPWEEGWCQGPEILNTSQQGPLEEGSSNRSPSDQLTVVRIEAELWQKTLVLGSDWWNVGCPD